MFWLFVTFLWAAMLLSPFILLYLFLPTGRECPRCTAETVQLRSRMLRPVQRIATLRWCLSCGWQGVARRAVIRGPMPKFEVVPDEANDDDAPWRGT